MYLVQIIVKGLAPRTIARDKSLGTALALARLAAQPGLRSILVRYCELA